MSSCVALVVAAGRGTRLGGALPKQYLDLGGKMLLRHALDSLTRHRAIAAVRAVLDPGDAAYYEQATQGLDLPPPPAPLPRRESSSIPATLPIMSRRRRASISCRRWPAAPNARIPFDSGSKA